jgi:phage terminase large subunit-like protein
MALRIPGPRGDAPCAVVSTTPKPSPLLKEIMAAKDTVTTRSTTFDNALNLDPSTLQSFRDRYEGSTLGRQELLAEVLLDSDGALWNRAMLDASRVKPDAVPDMKRVVVGVDPSGTKRGDVCGIVVCGLGDDGHLYVLSDHSLHASPESWARKVVAAYRASEANICAVEQNYGGEMCRAVIASVDRDVPVRLVHASRGKEIRAEPVVAKFEQNRAHIVGSLTALEDECCEWEPTGNMPSPGRLDAMVWGMTSLMQGYQQPFNPAVGPVIVLKPPSIGMDGWPEPTLAQISGARLW